MRRERLGNRRFVVPAAIVAGLVLLLALAIDDWSRDFTSGEAFIAPDAKDPRLRPLVSRLPSSDLTRAARAAAGRIRDWEYVGEASDADAARLLFVRTSRLRRLRSDIVIRIEDLGGERRLTGESRSPTGLVGDLGANPRALRRFLAEVRDVLEGAAPPSRDAAAEAR